MSDRPTIIVTGCSSGIGAHCAHALHADGWRVFATVRRDEDRGALESQGIETFLMDYTKPETIAALVEAVMARSGGRIDALFNNGAYGQAGAVEDLPTEALRLQLETNVIGWHDLTRRVIPAMRRAEAAASCNAPPSSALCPTAGAAPITHRSLRSRRCR